MVITAYRGESYINVPSLDAYMAPSYNINVSLQGEEFQIIFLTYLPDPVFKLHSVLNNINLTSTSGKPNIVNTNIQG